MFTLLTCFYYIAISCCIISLKVISFNYRKTPPEENEESKKNEAENDLPQLESSAAPKKENKSLDIDLESKLTFLLNAKVILALYSEILEREIPNELEFDGEMFKVMCSLSLVQIGILFAKRGTWTALDILMTKTKVLHLIGPEELMLRNCNAREFTFSFLRIRNMFYVICIQYDINVADSSSGGALLVGDVILSSGNFGPCYIC